MPVIRADSTMRAVPTVLRKALLEQLANERAGKPQPNGPLIFEIPLEQSDKIDVLAVWQAFSSLRAEDCTGLIMEVYKDQEARIAQALGVTYNEAMEQNLLPYAVVPMAQPDDVDPAELRKAMLAEGASASSDGKVELRFPSMLMAKTAHRRLCEGSLGDIGPLFIASLSLRHRANLGATIRLNRY